MSDLMSYNQLIAIYGEDDDQVIAVKNHLDKISISPDGTKAYSNYDLEAFRRVSTNNKVL